jgi:hypothetical protein
MKSFQIVDDFTVVERLPGYDVMNNPQRLTVAELIPIGVNWKSGGIFRSIQNQDGVIGVLLRDLSGIAIVEAPYDPSSNKAYIIDSDGKIRAHINPQINLDHLMFYDVLYTRGTLAFLAAAANHDVRVEVNDVDGIVSRIAESR